MVDLNLFLAGPPIQAFQIQCLFRSQVGPSKFVQVHQNSKFYMYLNGTWALGPFQGPIVILVRVTSESPLSYRIMLILFLEEVDGVPSHISAQAPSHISAHIKIPNVFLLQSSSIGLLPVTVSKF